MKLDEAVCYDVESFPNCFTLTAEKLHDNIVSTWEISDWRDDRQSLFLWFKWLHDTQTPMIGFNNVGYDYLMVHFLWTHPQATAADLYRFNQELFASNDRFGRQIWERDRFAPQIDLFKIHHFDNKAKTTSLKALQINMRSPTVMDSPIPFGTMLEPGQVEQYIIPYNRHDVTETKRFAIYSLEAIEFRIGLIGQLALQTGYSSHS